MITKDKLKNFRADFAEAVKNLETKYGVKMSLGNITYTDTNFRCRLDCNELSESGEKKVDTKRFEYLKAIFGFNGNIGDSYKGFDGRNYTVVKLDERKRRYPVIVKCNNGKQYKLSIAAANMYLKLGTDIPSGR